MLVFPCTPLLSSRYRLSTSQLESQYRHSHIAKVGPALTVAYAEVTTVSGNVDIDVAVELIASVEAVLAAMLTCSQSNIRRE